MERKTGRDVHWSSPYGSTVKTLLPNNVTLACTLFGFLLLILSLRFLKCVLSNHDCSTRFIMYKGCPHLDNPWIHVVFSRRFRMPYSSIQDFVSLAQDHALFERFSPSMAEEASAHSYDYAQPDSLAALARAMPRTFVLAKVEYHLRQSHLDFKSSHTARSYNITVNHRQQILATTTGHPARWNDKTFIVLFDNSLLLYMKVRRCCSTPGAFFLSNNFVFLAGLSMPRYHTEWCHIWSLRSCW